MLYKIKKVRFDKGDYSGDMDTIDFMYENPDSLFDLDLKHIDNMCDVYIIFETRKSAPEEELDGIESHEYGWLRIDAMEPWIDCLGVFNAL